MTRSFATGEALDCSGHTAQDAAALIVAGVDPASTQPRERPVLCVSCGRPTMHQQARCDEHYRAPHAARRAVTS